MMNPKTFFKSLISSTEGASSLFYDLMFFAICLQMACYLTFTFQVFGPSFRYPLSPLDLSVNGIFSINAWSGLIGGTGILIGVGMLLLRQNTYAIYAILLFAFGIFFNIVQTFVFAIPNTVSAIFASANVPTGATDPIQLVVGEMVLFAGFIYLAELAVQRKLN
jgi:hypothetical protein